MQRVAKTARLINGMDRVPSVHLGPNPAEQACAGEALPPLDVTGAALDRRHRIIQIHIQAKLENLPRSRIATSQRDVRLIVVMKGWGCFIFHTLRVPRRPTPRNPSWHLTAHCEMSSASLPGHPAVAYLLFVRPSERIVHEWLPPTSRTVGRRAS